MTPVRFALVLRLPGRQRLERFLAASADPRSPLYGRRLGAAAFGRRFGVATPALEAAIRRFQRAGVRVTHVYPERTRLDLQAPAGVVERLFATRLADFRDAQGRRYYRPEGRVVLPPAWAAVASGVTGLDTRPRSFYGLVPAGGLKPLDTEKIYDLGPLHRAGMDGAGQSIAIISADAAEVPSDLAAYDQRYGLPPHRTQVVNVGGSTSAQGSGENDLDLQVIHSIAPKALIYDYNISGTGLLSIAPAISRILQTHSADIVSVSLGFCEPLNGTKANMQGDANEIAAARAAGINVFISSGDSGAYGCQRWQPNSTALAAEYPSTSPDVVAVGGTSLSVAQDGSYLSESPWNVVLEQGGAGGGLSTVFSRPAYQTGPGVQNGYSNGMRQVPDVSADADTNTGWSVACTPCGGPQFQIIGGTSASSPFWAASMLLVEQYARQHGVPHLGFINPVLYGIGANQSPAPAFHDVTLGTNRYYPATPGWDFASGWGSPDVANLARDVVSYLQSNGPSTGP